MYKVNLLCLINTDQQKKILQCQHENRKKSKFDTPKSYLVELVSFSSLGPSFISSSDKWQLLLLLILIPLCVCLFCRGSSERQEWCVWIPPRRWTYREEPKFSRTAVLGHSLYTVSCTYCLCVSVCVYTCTVSGFIFSLLLIHKMNTWVQQKQVVNTTFTYYLLSGYDELVSK